MSDEGETGNMVRYCTPQSPTQTLHLFHEIFQAEGGVIVLDEKHAAELDRLMKTGKRPDLTQAFTKIDEEAAVALVENWKSKNRPAARSGMFTHDASPEKQAQMAMEGNRTNSGNIAEIPPSKNPLEPPPVSTGDKSNPLANFLKK